MVHARGRSSLLVRSAFVAIGFALAVRIHSQVACLNTGIGRGLSRLAWWYLWHSGIPGILWSHVVLGRHGPAHVGAALDLRVPHGVQVRLRVAQLQIQLLFLSTHDIWQVLTAAACTGQEVIYAGSLLELCVVIIIVWLLNIGQ